MMNPRSLSTVETIGSGSIPKRPIAQRKPLQWGIVAILRASIPATISCLYGRKSCLVMKSVGSRIWPSSSPKMATSRRWKERVTRNPQRAITPWSSNCSKAIMWMASGAEVSSRKIISTWKTSMMKCANGSLSWSRNSGQSPTLLRN